MSGQRVASSQVLAIKKKMRNISKKIQKILTSGGKIVYFSLALF